MGLALTETPADAAAGVLSFDLKKIGLSQDTPRTVHRMMVMMQGGGEH